MRPRFSPVERFIKFLAHCPAADMSATVSPWRKPVIGRITADSSPPARPQSVVTSFLVTATVSRARPSGQTLTFGTHRLGLESTLTGRSVRSASMASHAPKRDTRGRAQDDPLPRDSVTNG